MNFRRILRRITIAFAISIPVFLAIGGAVLAEGALRVPRRPIPQHAGQRVQIAAADGAVLKGTFLPSTKSTRCVIVLHGIADTRMGALGFASMFQEEGFAIQAAAMQPTLFDSIVSECAYSDLPTIAEYRVAQVLGVPEALATVVARPFVWSATIYARLRYELDLTGASPVRSAKKLATPLLLIHGLKDTATPPEHSRRIHTSTPPGVAELWEVPGAHHATASRDASNLFRAHVMLRLHAAAMQR